jgi:tetratricopeptide (TPR) repeat protein
MGQANLFKELGNYQGAIDLYSKINDQRKTESITISKAAIYVALGEFEKVFAMIPDKDIRTKEDWVSYHIKGMALLKSGKKSAAQEHFKYGYDNVPFASQKAYFKTALAIALIKGREYSKALEVLGSREDSISNVIKLHAYCGLNKRQEAAQSYKSLIKDTDDNIVYLSEEIGAHFRLNRNQPKHESGWINDKECDLLSIDISIDKAA